MSKAVAYIRGHLSWKSEHTREEISLGDVSLPLVPKKISNDTPYLSYGIGVDLDETRRTIEEIFRQNSNDEVIKF